MSVTIQGCSDDINKRLGFGIPNFQRYNFVIINYEDQELKCSQYFYSESGYGNHRHKYNIITRRLNAIGWNEKSGFMSLMWHPLYTVDFLLNEKWASYFLTRVSYDELDSKLLSLLPELPDFLKRFHRCL